MAVPPASLHAAPSIFLRRLRALRKGAGLSVFACLVGALSCREPTQIKLVVTTDVGCPQGVEVAPRINDIIILTGRKLERTGGEVVPNAQTDQCSSSAKDPTPPVDPPNEIGSLVLLPDGEDPAVEVLVVAGVTVGEGAVQGSTSMGAGACATRVNSDQSIEGMPCIVSRRRLTFVDHNSLVLPVLLDARCIGEECGADLTCYQGNCVSPDVDCDPDAPECTPPIACEEDCEAACGSSNAQCVGGECRCLTCNVEECGDDCKAPSAPFCDPDTDSCSCVICEDDACDMLCGGDGTCDGALCVCDGCYEEGCEALPCEAGGTFQCVGRPPNEVCSCEGSCDPSDCDQSCDRLGGAGLVGRCDNGTCACVCDADQCAADCDGTCNGNQCECVAPCSTTACDESLGACQERGQVRVCAPFCACACEAQECTADCVADGHDGGHCNTAPGAEDCICDDDLPEGGGGAGGSLNGGAPPNGGAPATGGGGADGGGGGALGGGGASGGGGSGGAPGDCCAIAAPACDPGESPFCFPGDFCQCTCDAMECLAQLCPAGQVGTCNGMGPGSCQCQCNPTECSAACGIQGGSCQSMTNCQCNGCPSPVPAPDCGMCDMVCMGMGGPSCTAVTCSPDSSPVQCFCM